MELGGWSQNKLEQQSSEAWNVSLICTMIWSIVFSLVDIFLIDVFEFGCIFLFFVCTMYIYLFPFFFTSLYMQWISLHLLQIKITQLHKVSVIYSPFFYCCCFLYIIYNSSNYLKKYRNDIKFKNSHTRAFSTLIQMNKDALILAKIYMLTCVKISLSKKERKLIQILPY